VILACQSQPRGVVRVHLERTKTTLGAHADTSGEADEAVPAA
jgi:hypothetical protein